MSIECFRKVKPGDILCVENSRYVVTGSLSLNKYNEELIKIKLISYITSDNLTKYVSDSAVGQSVRLRWAMYLTKIIKTK